MHYTLRRNRRSRSMTLRIYPNGAVVVTTHPLTPRFLVDLFISRKKKWITDARTKLGLSENAVSANPPERISKIAQRKSYLAHKEQARIIATERLQHFNRHYNFTYRKIAIRDQRSRWGSCSKQGNLNFNYKISLLPAHLSDYIVVHELCHIGQFNHSSQFWALVAETLPNHKALRTELKSLRIASLLK